jgi:hypothetical protein
MKHDFGRPGGALGLMGRTCAICGQPFTGTEEGCSGLSAATTSTSPAEPQPIRSDYDFFTGRFVTREENLKKDWR